MSDLTLRLQRKIAAETGDRFDYKPLKRCWACSFIPILALVLSSNFVLAIVVLGLFIGLHFYLVLRQFRSDKSREWNPARHLVYWGAGLACLGYALSAGILAVLVGSVITASLAKSWSVR